MGCYGLGVSRLAAAAVEQSYDKDGIIWPVAIAPYHVIVTIPNVADATQVKAAEQLYNQLNSAGIERYWMTATNGLGLSLRMPI
jgi:prolyl-tRNA synthetase